MKTLNYETYLAMKNAYDQGYQDGSVGIPMNFDMVMDFWFDSEEETTETTKTTESVVSVVLQNEADGNE